MAAASGSVISDRRAEVGQAQRPGASRSCLYGPQLAGWLTATMFGRRALPLGDLVDHPAQQPGHERLGRVRACRRAGSGVGSPMRRLNSRATRPGSVSPRRLAASPVSDCAVLAQEHHRRDGRRAVAEGGDLDPSAPGTAAAV